ncbi:MAG: hypothetical protein HY907_12665 [Deltaproteobacteria bacterium]|nr:hypothetical protein [Deltaproteobacteria bacterium]
MTTTGIPHARFVPRRRLRRAAAALLLLAAAATCKRGSPPVPQPDVALAPLVLDVPAAKPADGGTTPQATAEPPGPPEDPREALTLRTYDVLLDGSIACRATTAGVVIEEAAQPERPRRLSVVHLPGSVNDVAWIGRVQPPRPATCPEAPGGPVCPIPPPVTLVAAAAGPAGVFLIDVTDPEHPSQVGTFDTAGAAMRLAPAPPLLWVADGSGGVLALDLADPARPKAVAGVSEPPAAPEPAGATDAPADTSLVDAPDDLPPAFYVRDVVPFGERLFVAASFRGLLVYDVRAAPGGPSLEPRLTFDTPGDARAVAVDGDRVWVADGPSGLQVIDTALHRPDAAPAVVATYPTRDVCRDVKLDVNRDKTLFPPVAYLAVGDHGLEILDASDLSSLSVLGRHVPRRPVNRVTVGPNGLLLLANDADGLMIVDAADPTAIRQIFPAP